MSKYALPLFALLLLTSLGLAGFTNYQSDQVSRKDLRTMLTQLGYDVKDLIVEEGKEKYSVTVTEGGLDIPIGYEISPNNAYIWLTVNLGAAPTTGTPKTLALLKRNAKTQPSFFYITDSGRLMMALAIENRNVNNAVLRLRTESLSKNVVSSEADWKAQ